MKVIGVGGYARCGKDTFVSIAKEILIENGFKPIRVAFADDLKCEVQSMLEKNNFPLDIYTNDSEAKSKIRPLLVWWGCARRDLNDSGLYWVNKINEKLTFIQQEAEMVGINVDNLVVMVSDVRFENEVEWLQNKQNGTFIHLRRFKTVDGVQVFDEAPNAEEAKNDPLIRKVADVKVEWESRGILPGESVNQDPYLRGIVMNALSQAELLHHNTTETLSR